MLYLVLILIGSLVLFVGGIWREVVNDIYSFPWGFFVASLGALTGLIALVLILVLAIGRPVGHRTCTAWGKQTGVPVKFVLLNDFDTGTCLAKTPDGKWVQNSNWYAYVGVNH